MSKKKTDWEIARGLADWVISLNLKKQEHQRWDKGNLVEDYYYDDYVETYVDNQYVSLKIFKDHKCINRLDIHPEIIYSGLTLGKEIPSWEELVLKTKEWGYNLNIRYWNKVYRNKLKFLKDNVEERRKANIEEQIKIYTERIKDLRKKQ